MKHLSYKTNKKQTFVIFFFTVTLFKIPHNETLQLKITRAWPQTVHPAFYKRYSDRKQNASGIKKKKTDVFVLVFGKHKNKDRL